jgi:hypothetical protein
MRYSLWSHDRLVGYTDLDIRTVTPTMRQGFVEPTPEGKALLEDATGVWRAMAERKRLQRARGGVELKEDDDIVCAAMERREALDLELRDESGEVFGEWIRVYDLFDSKSGVTDDMMDTEEEMEAAFQIRLSQLTPEEQAEALAQRDADQAAIDEFVAQWMEDRNSAEMFNSTWPAPAPEDPRWETMQYHLQVHLKSAFDIDLEIPGFEDFAE